MTREADNFFRNFTLSICSSLHIEAAMCNTMQMLEPYLPADEMYLCVFDYENSTFKIIARATKKDGILLNQVLPLPPKGLAAIRKIDRSKATILHRAEEDAILRSILSDRQQQTLSCLMVPLTIDGHIIGSALFLSGACQPYTEEHVALMTQVNQPFCVAVSNALEHIRLLQTTSHLNEENVNLKQKLHSVQDSEVIGSATGLSEVYEMLNLVAPLNSPVLIIGETGTGKEVIANAIYKHSSRNQGPFIKVNCGAIPDTLIDSELFGHEKGAFTGAIAKKIGRFERANGGTIFLDEIGELPLEAQVRLLRVIQEREIERVGGTASIPLDIRIICATNKSLKDMAEAGTFREDLFFRINVFPIFIPPLRQRTQDIPLLMEFFLKKKAQEMGLRHVPAVREEDIALLKKYSWPGNVRELQNIIERSLILSKGKTLEFQRILPDLYEI